MVYTNDSIILYNKISYYMVNCTSKYMYDRIIRIAINLLT